MNAFFMFQKHWIHPYLILQVMIDVENCVEFWRMNKTLICLGSAFILTLILYIRLSVRGSNGIIK